MTDLLNAAIAAFGMPNKAMCSRNELRFGKKGAIAVKISGEKAGAWYDFESAKGGYLTNPPETAPRHRAPAYSLDPERATLVRAYIAETIPASGTPVELYLRNRGIRCPIPHSLRFLKSPPGMVALFQNAAGAPLAIQITYITRAGQKADRQVQKQTFCTGAGWQKFSAIHIPGRGELVICEGVETGLSIHQATGRPIWCCTSVSNVSAIRVPYKRFTIARDGDKPGSPADELYLKTIRRHVAAGKKLKVAAPPTDMDFNDLLFDQGEGAIVDIFNRTKPWTTQS